MPSGGHNEKYTQELADMVVGALAEGKTIEQCVKLVGVDVTTLMRWRVGYADFDARCSSARKFSMDVKVDQLDEIAENEPDVNRARLRCDNIKWKASKIAAEVYGDRLDLNVTQSLDINSALLDASKRAALPPRDLEKVVECEVIETAPLNAQRAADSKSVEEEKTEQDQEVDIFS